MILPMINITARYSPYISAGRTEQITFALSARGHGIRKYHLSNIEVHDAEDLQALEDCLDYIGKYRVYLSILNSPSDTRRKTLENTAKVHNKSLEQSGAETFKN
jgi:hypothetical protein